MSKKPLNPPLPPPRVSGVIAAMVAGAGGAGFLIGSSLLWESAYAHQLSGQPMPNGKGGFMSYRGGYESAVFLLVFGLVWLWSATRFMRKAFATHDPEPTKNKPTMPNHNAVR